MANGVGLGVGTGGLGLRVGVRGRGLAAWDWRTAALFPALRAGLSAKAPMWRLLASAPSQFTGATGIKGKAVNRI